MRTLQPLCASAFLAFLAAAIGCASAVGTDAGDAASTADNGPIRSCPSVRADAGRLPGTSSIDSVRGAPLIGLARVTRVDEECSGAGGTHVTLEWVTVRCGPASGVDRVALGEHAFMPTPRPSTGSLMVVGAVPDARFAAAGSRDEPGWCLVGLPTVQGIVTGWAAVGSETEGAAILDMVAP